MSVLAVWLTTLIISDCLADVDSVRVSVPADIIELLQDPKRYNRHASPTQIYDTPTVVSIQMYIEGISSFRAETMDFNVDIYFQERWTDTRLRHNDTRRVLIKDPKLFELMWHPDLYFANARTSAFHEVTSPNFLVWIYANGTVYYDCRISLTVMCMQNLAKYPLDSQECKLRILSYAYDIEQLIIQWTGEPPIDKNEEILMPDMHLREIRPASRNDTYATGIWSCATAEFFVVREIMHHILQSYVPTGNFCDLSMQETNCISGLIVVISWFSFWLDVDAVPGRVSLSITTLLTLATQSSAARLALPQVSYIKAIDVWMGTCMSFVFGVMVEFTFVNYWTRRKGPMFPSCTCSWKGKLRHLYTTPVTCTASTRYDNPNDPSSSPLFNQRMGCDQGQYSSKIRLQSEPGTPGMDTLYQAYEYEMEEQLQEQQRRQREISPRASSVMRPLHCVQSANGEVRVAAEEGTTLIHRVLKNRTEIIEPTPKRRTCFSELPTPTTPDQSMAPMITVNDDPRISPQESSRGGSGGGPDQSQQKWTSSVRKLQMLRKWKNRKMAQRIDRYSRICFPLTFIVFNIVYWIYYVYIA